MKKKLLALLLSANAFTANFFTTNAFASGELSLPNGLISKGHVSVGSVASARGATILDVQSTTQGETIPSMTTTQMNAIGSPFDGLLVYNTTQHAPYAYENGSWTLVGGTYTLPAATTSTLGGTFAIASVSHQWVYWIDNTGQPHLSQPGFSDLSGSATTGQMPADVAYTNQSNYFGGGAYSQTIGSEGSLTVEFTNDSTTGTTNSKLVKISSTGAVIASIGDTNGILGIVFSGGATTGTAYISVAGSNACVFDNTAVVGDFVQISSSTAGDCHDAGSNYPTSGQVIGKAEASGAGTKGVALGSYGTSSAPLTLPVSQANGGTGTGSPTPSPSPSHFAMWDLNNNLLANNHVSAFASVVTSGGTTTFTVASAANEQFTGTNAQTVVLPVVSTLPQTGFTFNITNSSTGLVTVESSGANVINTIASGQSVQYQDVSLTGTTAASWNAISGFGYVAQAQWYGSNNWGVTASCDWTGSSTSTPTNWSAVSACPVPTSAGNVTAPATKIPAVTLASVAPGTYRFVLKGAVRNSPQDSCGYRFSDGTNNTVIEQLSGSAAGENTTPMLEGEITYTVPQSNITVQIQSSCTAAGDDASIVNNVANVEGLEMSVYYFPSQNQLVANTALNWPTFSVNTSSTSATTTTNFVYSVVANDSNGGYSTSTGKYTVPTGAGGMWHFSGVVYAGSTATGLSLKDGSTVICQGASSVASTVPGDISCDYPVSAGDTLALYPTTTATASGSSYQNSFSGYQIVTSQQQPISIGGVTSTGAGQYHTESATMSSVCTGTCTIASQSGSWLSSITRNSTGNYTANITAGEFSSTPTCVVSSLDGGAGYNICTNVGAATTSADTVLCSTSNTGSAVDSTFSIICMGPH